MLNVNGSGAAQLRSGDFHKRHFTQIQPPNGGSGKIAAHASPIIKASQIRVAEKRVLVNGSCHGGVPQVLLHRRNNVVESAEIVCSCGERIVVQCEYSDA